MTLTTPYSATFIVGDGETKTFSYLFEEVSPNFISVMVYNSVTGLISTPTYVIDTDQKQVIFGEDTPAPTADETVCIYRNTPNVQDVAFRTLHGYDAQTLENILSKIVAMIQEIKSNYFSTQVLQGDPWQLDLLSSADDGATVNIDYTAKKLVKGLYFRITSGNLQVSADGVTYLTLPKSDDVAEFRQYEQTLPDLTVIRKLQYRVGNQWFDAEANAQYTADEAYALAESVQTTMSAHINNTTNPHQTSLANLTDTDLTGLVANQFLRFNGIKWVPITSSETVYWGDILGTLSNQTDLQTALDGKVNDTGDTMTGALNIIKENTSNETLLSISNSSTVANKWNFTPKYNGATLYLYPGSSMSDGYTFSGSAGFSPLSNGVKNLGTSGNKWKTLYVNTLNNGADIAIPNKSGTLATTADVELAANSGSQLYSTGVWYAKMYAASTVPTGAEYDGTNYADFSQVDADNNPVIKIYTGASGAWTLTDTITPPAEYNGYIWVTSKIWDIVEQTGQQGGEVLWDHTHKTFTPYPRIIDVDLTNYVTTNTVQTITALKTIEQLDSAAITGTALVLKGDNQHLETNPATNVFNSINFTDVNDATVAKFSSIQTSDGWSGFLAGCGSDPTHPHNNLLMIANGTSKLLLIPPTTSHNSCAVRKDYLDTTLASSIGNGIITLTQGGATKGTFTVNQSENTTIDLDAGGTTTGQSIDAEIVGTLTITDNSVVSGFSNSNYLKLPGVFELGSSDTNSFEIGASFTTTSVADSDMKTIITGRQPGSTNNAAGIDIRYADISDQKIRVVIINGTNQTLTGTTNLSPNTKYYIKFEYDGTDYKLWLSTDGASYSLEVSAAMSKLATPAELLVGKASLASPQSVDMAGLYIKKNGQIIWQGMDAPGLHQRVAKGHEVIAFQAPKSTNNYTWYRKYADGWVEQGGITTNDEYTPVILPIPMQDTNYVLLGQCEGLAVGNYNFVVIAKTTTSFTADASYGGGVKRASWQVSGMAA